MTMTHAKNIARSKSNILNKHRNEQTDIQKIRRRMVRNGARFTQNGHQLQNTYRRKKIIRSKTIYQRLVCQEVNSYSLSTE